MATIMSLTNEVIVVILKKLSIKDIENFSSTCKKFRQTAWDNRLWIKKFYQRWPSMKKVYGSMKNEDLCQIDFKEQVKATVKFSKEMWELVSQIYMDKLSDADKRDLVLNFLCANVYSPNYFILMEEFKRMFSHSSREPGCDLTRRYYSFMIFRLLRHYRTRYKCLKYIKTPKEQQFLEEIVTIVVQWFNPFQDISYSYIKALLDEIALNVLQVLKEQCPTHPIFAMANEYYNYWKNNNIDYSYWNYEEILPILFVTGRIIFSQAYFHTLNQLWLPFLNDSQDANYISGGIQSLFLLTIYHSVMRRFGVYSLLIAGSLQLYVKPKDNTKNVEYYCLQLRYGQFCFENVMRTDRCTYKRDHFVIITILIDYLNEKLQSLIREELVMLKHTLTGNYVNVSDSIMKRIEALLRKKDPEERSAKIKFVIGTIVTHRCNNETHIGVIVGWNHNYAPLSTFNTRNNLPIIESNMLCKNLNCADSTCCTHEPYYSILCEKDTYCYTKQENVSKYDSSKWIVHEEIGRYFCRYESNYYVPNEMLAKSYPSDVAIINEMRRNQ